MKTSACRKKCRRNPYCLRGGKEDSTCSTVDNGRSDCDVLSVFLCVTCTYYYVVIYNRLRGPSGRQTGSLPCRGEKRIMGLGRTDAEWWDRNHVQGGKVGIVRVVTRGKANGCPYLPLISCHAARSNVNTSILDAHDSSTSSYITHPNTLTSVGFILHTDRMNSALLDHRSLCLKNSRARLSTRP